MRYKYLVRNHRNGSAHDSLTVLLMNLDFCQSLKKKCGMSFFLSNISTERYWYQKLSKKKNPNHSLLPLKKNSMEQDGLFVKSIVSLKWLIVLAQTYHKVQVIKKTNLPFDIVLLNEVEINGLEIIVLHQVMRDKDPIYCSAWGMENSKLILFTGWESVLTIG